MLPHYDLTPEGVRQKLDDLYALSDNDLAIQANAIKSDFPSWMSDNFGLTTAQATYLNGLVGDATDYYGSQACLCFLSRLPILLVQEPAVTGHLKLVRTENTLTTKADASGGFITTGSFIFKIVYEPVS